MEKGGKGMKEIPYDAVFEILSRLPVQSLLRFRSVCKSWNALISNNSQFIKSQLQRSTESNSRQRLMDFYSSRHFCSIDYALKFCNYYFDPPLKNGFRISWFLLCSCDGLVLFEIMPQIPKPNEHTFMLWNPATRKYYKSFSCHYDSKWVRSNIGYGLCYDSSVDSYKVFIYIKKTIMVYDVKSGSWSVFNQPFYSISSYQIGVHVNGKLHWISSVQDNGGNYSIAIVYFDLLEDEFKEVPLLDQIWNKMGLGVLGGQLCVYNYDFLNCEIKTWVMREYGNKESWTNFAVIPCPRNQTFYRVLTFTEKDDVLLEFAGQGSLKEEVIMYNPSKGAFRSIFLPGSTMTTYVESLVLLNSENEIKRQHTKHPRRLDKNKGKMKK